MSGRTWVLADVHAYHHSVCKFLRHDGTKLRPWDDAEKMTEDMIRWHNELVHPEDRVYILGDVAMNRKALDRYLPRIMGRKILVKGNHDTDKLSYYSQYFDDIRACVVKKGFIMSHIPIHPASLSRWNINIHGHPASLSRWSINIHGHLHANEVMKDENKLLPVPDPRYVCVSVEHTDYRPILLDKVLEKAGLK